MAPTLLQRRNRRNRKIVATAAAFGTVAAAFYYTANYDKMKQHTSRISGQQWMDELLDGHPLRIKDNLGITQEGFRQLESLLIRKSGLEVTRYMSTTEQLGIFLYAVVTDLSMRKLAERFQHSTETLVLRVSSKVSAISLYTQVLNPFSEVWPRSW
jgi:hypothetical protein